MSGILKSIGKVFKKIIKSPIFKIAMIAVAVYFTGGLALGALGSTFAAALPGIAGAAEGLGITAGAFAAGAGEAATVAAAAAANAGLAATGAGESIGMTAAEAAAATGAASFGEAGAVGATVGATTDASLGSAGIVNAADAGATAAEAAGAGATDASLGAAGADTATNGLGSATLNAGTDIGANGVDVQQVTGTGFGGNGATGVPGSADTLQTSQLSDQLTQPLSTDAAAKTPQFPSGQNATQVFNQAGTNTSTANIFNTSVPGGSLTAPTNIADVPNWWNNLDPTTKKLAYDGLSQAAKSAIGAIGQKQVLDQQQKNIDQNKADIIRKGAVVDRTSFYKTPSVINSAINGQG